MVPLRKSHYLLPDKAAEERYLNNMWQVVQTTVVWPPIEEMLLFGNKKLLGEHLDRAAADKTQTLRPEMAAVAWGSSTERADIVYKRAYSGYSDMVLIPGKCNFPPKWEQLKAKDPRFDSNWLSQAFVEGIGTKVVGELRAFFVGSKIVYTVHTAPAGEDVTQAIVQGMYTPEEWG